MTTQTYNLIENKTELIEINGNVVNFKAHFSIVAPKPFEMAVVDQNILDSGRQIQFQQVPSGEIDGDVEATYDHYQPYYIAIRTNTSMPVQLELALQDVGILQKKEPYVPPKDSGTNWGMYIGIGVVVLICIGIFIWWYYKSNPTPPVVNTFPQNDNSIPFSNNTRNLFNFDGSASSDESVLSYNPGYKKPLSFGNKRSHFPFISSDVKTPRVDAPSLPNSTPPSHASNSGNISVAPSASASVSTPPKSTVSESVAQAVTKAPSSTVSAGSASEFPLDRLNSLLNDI